MRTVLAMVVAMSLAAGTLSVASAADEKKANPQQERMKACNSQAGDKKGASRLVFEVPGSLVHPDHIASFTQLR